MDIYLQARLGVVSEYVRDHLDWCSAWNEPSSARMTQIVDAGTLREFGGGFDSVPRFVQVLGSLMMLARCGWIDPLAIYGLVGALLLERR